MFVKFLKLFIFSVTLFAAFIVIAFFAYPGQPPKDTKFGVTFSRKQAEGFGLDWKKTYIDILDDLGAKNLRLSAYWSDIEPEK